MKTRTPFFGSLLLACLGAVALAGCGGGVTGVRVGDDGGTGDDNVGDDNVGDDGGSDPRCPAPSQIAGGGSCSLSGVSCPESQVTTSCDGSSRPLTCFCDGVSWTCEHSGPPPCPTSCPAASAVKNGGACTAEGRECLSNDLPVGNCAGGIGTGTSTGYCTCKGGAWSCPVLEPPCVAPPQQQCPDPSMLVPGQKCSVSSDLVCNSTQVSVGCPVLETGMTTGSCSCYDGTWSCEVAVPACPPPMACPDPSTVYAYGSCYTGTGMTCSGNPQLCGGETYYDAFSCTGGGYWQQLTTTTCDLYGGDGGWGEDAGVATADAGF